MKICGPKTLIISISVFVILFFGMFTINQYRNSKHDWQTQFDLGTKYLLDKNYSQAILCFTRAITIDSQRYEAYKGRAEAHLASVSDQESLTLAKQDYETALSLEADDPDLYLALSEIYEKLGALDSADQIREQGFLQTGDDRFESICEHEWLSANYQEAQTCTLCGETFGDPLPAALADLSMMATNVSYSYVTQCLEDSTQQTVAQAVIEQDTNLVSDETHPAKDGYIWKKITVTITTNDDNAWAYGIRIRMNFLDYYTGTPLDSPDESTPETFIVNYKGKEYTCTAYTSQPQSNWNGHIFTWSVDCSFCVPEGYDGCVSVLYNASHETISNSSFNSIISSILQDTNTLYFRVI